MKKRGLALLLAGMLLLCSCGQKADPSGYKSEEADPGGAGMKRVVTSGVTNGYERGCYGMSSWFVVKPDEFFAELERRAKEKGITGFEEKVNNFGRHTYFLNGKRVLEITEIIQASAKDGSDVGCLERVYLPSTATEEQLKTFSILSDIVIDMLNPGLSRQIADDLHIYDEDQKKWPNGRVLVCGDSWYSYRYDGTFVTLEITATLDRFEEPSPKVPTRQD